MFTENKFSLILKAHYVFDFLPYLFFINMNEIELNIYIKSKIIEWINNDKIISLTHKNISQELSDTYIASILLPLYDLDLDNIIYVVHNIKYFSLLDRYPKNIDIEAYKPINGWYKELQKKEIKKYLFYKNKNINKYLYLLEACLINLISYNELSYDDLLISPIYFLISGRLD